MILTGLFYYSFNKYLNRDVLHQTSCKNIVKYENLNLFFLWSTKVVKHPV